MKVHCFQNKWRKRCFSLVELLAVISIIGILSGLLLPALNAARNRAHTISCMGNVKQIGQAYCSYLSDWDMTPPVSRSGVRWIDCLVPCLAEKSRRSAGNVFVCPSDRRPEDKKVVYGTSDLNKLSYGINQCYPSDRESATPILWNGIGATLIRNPSEFITLADAGSYYIGTTVAAPFFGTLNGESYVDGGYCKYLAFRHGGRAREFNAAFADGHAAALNFDATPDRYWDYRSIGYGF